MSLRIPLFALAFACAAAPSALAQVVLSEIDTRTPGTDRAEFIEIYNGGPSAVNLADYALVLFDGAAANNGSYAAYDLSGTLAADAFFVVCGDDAQVANCDLDLSATDFLQDGTDAVALYRADASVFPNGTAPSTPNLTDAIVYGETSDSGLRSALNRTQQFDENEDAAATTESLQRTPNPTSSTLEALAPTPGASPAARFPAAVTIADLRGRGAGSTDTIEGIVTRAEGSLLFLQDATAGLQIVAESGSGASGQLAAAIASGTVAAGTVLNLTGTISDDFNALVIENSDLQRFGVVGIAPVPDPVVVTLAQFEANAEDYEGELVQFAAVTVDNEGDAAFLASNTYEIDDPSSTTFPVSVRVPNAEDTRAEGTAIPSGSTVLTGPAGQRGSLSNNGYRIYLIDPVDVGGNATADGGGTGGGGSGGGGGTGGGDASDLPLVISEIDVSQTGTDTGEFVEIYNAGSVAVDLSTVSLVLFNGADDASYFARNLSGTLAPGAFYVVCSDIAVIDMCNLELFPSSNLVQGGADAVALYESAASAFPTGTAPTTTNLVDAIVYGTNDPTDAGLLTALGQTTQYDEDANGADDTESLQRSPTADAATFEALSPTPGVGPGEATPGPGTPVTIAEARTAGVGETVTVRGTVTRSEGAFTYLQDNTAAIAIRQTAGTFANLVSLNMIQPGIVLEVTGTLSTFNGLLQINGDDLTDFEIVDAAEVPAPQLVTLAQLATNGEAFESELVALTRVSIDATPGEAFAAATTYPISDRTSAAGNVTLRVPSADDTEVDGELVPEGPVTVVGIVGQFDTTDPRTSGYQILVIEDSDVNLEAVETEDGPDGSLTLAVANPIRGAAVVTFGADMAGAVRLAVFDALGRRVAVLASGDAPAGTRSARLDAAALAPGVYVLRLETAAGIATRTVTVVR